MEMGVPSFIRNSSNSAPARAVPASSVLKMIRVYTTPVASPPAELTLKEIVSPPVSLSESSEKPSMVAVLEIVAFPLASETSMS